MARLGLDHAPSPLCSQIAPGHTVSTTAWLDQGQAVPPPPLWLDWGQANLQLLPSPHDQTSAAHLVHGEKRVGTTGAESSRVCPNRRRIMICFVSSRYDFTNTEKCCAYSNSFCVGKILRWRKINIAPWDLSAASSYTSGDDLANICINFTCPCNSTNHQCRQVFQSDKLKTLREDISVLSV